LKQKEVQSIRNSLNQNEYLKSLSGWPGTYYIVQAGFEIAILLPLPPKCWDYKYAPHIWPEITFIKHLKL
jgi:hypothetical protein